MIVLVNEPLFLFVLSFLLLWIAVQLGNFFGKHMRPLKERDRQDFRLVLTAVLTLLGLVVGFSFSMAISRYDQRKAYEEAEANAIGTAFVRADLLLGADATRMRQLLMSYLDKRLAFYTARDDGQLTQIDSDTAKLQTDLWAAIRTTATTQPNPVSALAVSAVNDVLNSEGYTRSSWWNRIPVAAWGFMVAIAIICNLILGYDVHETDQLLFVVLPLAIAIAFLLIADIDSPRGGIIRLFPQNLLYLSHTLHGS